MAADPGRRPRGPGLRARLVGLATLAVAAVLLVAGLGIARTLRQVLIDQQVTAGRARAADLAALAAEGALPRLLPETGDDALVQVVRGERVTAANVEARGAPPFALPRLAPGAAEVVTAERLDVAESGPFHVVAQGAATPEGPATVYVAVAQEEADEAVAAATQVGLAALPVLVALLAAAMWALVGRALRPVEDIRREADAITSAGLHRRVPEPLHADEVGRLARTVNAMLARLQEGSERQRRFVADAAHELRNPLAAIRAQLETARAARGPVDWDDVTADVLAETERLHQASEQLLTLARLDAREPPGRRVAVDLDDLVDAALRRHAACDGVLVETRGVQPVQVTGDPVLLARVVDNLMGNAVRHAQGRVAVVLDRAGGRARLTVDDDGPGIPPADRESVFLRFTRLDTARDRDRGGAGLGLAIVAEAVRAHGGEVRVLDGPLGGARLEVLLPLDGVVNSG